MLIVMWFITYLQVRAAGLGLAVTLTSTQEGRLLVNSNCKHIPGGIWGAAFSILLDQSECSMVRQQVGTTIFRAFLLSADHFQNQLFQKILSGIPSVCQTVWIQIRPDILFFKTNPFYNTRCVKVTNGMVLFLFDLILYVPVTNFQLCGDGSRLLDLMSSIPPLSHCAPTNGITNSISPEAQSEFKRAYNKGIDQTVSISKWVCASVVGMQKYPVFTF